ncbi:MAG: ABC transporter permease [Christensenellales bacterium]
MFVTFLASAISLGAIFLYGCVGEILTEKSGHLNLGIPGIMCMGTAGGCFGVSLYMGSIPDPANPNWFLLILISVVMAAVFAALLGLIYAFLTVTLRSNQNVTGLALTIFGVGFTQFFMDNFVDKTHFSKASTFFIKSLPFADSLGIFGDLVLSYGVLVYLAIAVALIASFVLNRTRVGLFLRAVGENPATADAAGINVMKYKYTAILTGSGIAGIGGLFYVMDFIKGSWENASTIEAMGWLAIALVIFTLWKPNLSILGSFVFGGLYIAANYIIGVSFSQMKLLKLLPYVVTIIVLIVTSILDKKENQPPAALGMSYFREDR